ncbi:unnamed protein product [Cylicocyclus nassatus]|uniref:Nose resistant-to-fluoxetine protein N-terminal domain-containing protein n=1 Tax=Cylicocyclus nassatus TaxID=53992 RepID=A0AA36DL20_CYLNA|nr:unnamed protein product [Cylicocyclus nassatus]
MMVGQLPRLLQQPIPLPFNPAKILNETELTQGCLMDVTSFSTGVTRFTSTFAACRQQGKCTEAQQKVLDDNIFAIKQLDAFGKIPSGILDLTLVSSGSYSECMDVEAPYQVQYCYATSEITNMTGLAPKEVGMPSNFKVGPRLAVCMPERCTSKDITSFLNAANSQTLLPAEFSGISCVPKHNTYSLAFWIYMSVLGFFVSWAIVATAVDYVWQNHYKDKEQNKGDLEKFLIFAKAWEKMVDFDMAVVIFIARFLYITAVLLILY